MKYPFLAALGVVACTGAAHAADLDTSYTTPGDKGRAPGVVIMCPSADGTVTAAACNFGSGGGSSGPVGVTTTQTPGTTSATAGTFTTAAAANASRKGCTIQNTSSAALYVYFGTAQTPSTGNSFTVPAGLSLSCLAGPIVLQDAIAVAGAQASQSYVLALQ